MLIDMMKDIELKAGEAAPPEPHRFAPADEQVIKGVVERIRGALLQEIQDMNVENPALAMISLPPECPISPLASQPRRLTGRFDQAQRALCSARPVAVRTPRRSRGGASAEIEPPDHSADAFGSRPVLTLSRSQD